MPELPEVEISARVAKRALNHRVVNRVVIKECKLFRPPATRNEELDSSRSKLIDIDQLSPMLQDATPLAPYTLRHGKLMACLFVSRDQRVFCLYARLGMTGKFVSRSLSEKPHQSCKLSLYLQANSKINQELEPLRLDFLNTRMFGQLWIESSVKAIPQANQLTVLTQLFKQEIERSAMGLDAYELSQNPKKWLNHIRTQANQRKVKTALLDQSLLAGIGNIYAAEALFEAKAHPLARFQDLSDKQIRLLAQGVYQSMTATLVSAEGQHEIFYGSGKGQKSPFQVYGREGLPCLSCGETLCFLRISGRATVFCSLCQKQESLK